VHQIKLSEVNDDKALTRAVLQIGEMLGLYQAELARVLGLQCADIGAIASGKRQLSAGSPAWQQARGFVSLYELLYRHCGGDPVAIYHWLRSQPVQFNTSPLLMMVDEGRLSELVDFLQPANTGNLSHAGKKKS
jgi:hypothetical protein